MQLYNGCAWDCYGDVRERLDVREADIVVLHIDLEQMEVRLEQEQLEQQLLHARLQNLQDQLIAAEDVQGAQSGPSVV